MTVQDVLEAAGYDPGKRGRTRCPIHLGESDQSFSYRDDVWHCFGCGAGGNSFQLQRHFVPQRTDPLEGLPEPLRDFAHTGVAPWAPLEGLRPSTWLLARREAMSIAFDEAASVLHQQALWQMDRFIPRMLTAGGEALFLEAGAAWQQASYQLWLAEEVLGCQCQ